MTAPLPDPKIPLPLTPLQQGMYFTWLQDPAAGIDVEQMVCTLPETTDAPRLRAAWEALASAHPILRTTFTAEAATVHDSLSFPWQELDSTDIAAFLEKDRSTPLHLTQGPLQRLTLIRQSPENYQLIWIGDDSPLASLRHQPNHQHSIGLRI